MTIMPTTTVLEVRDLKKYFPVRRGFFGRQIGTVRAVDGITFALRSGERRYFLLLSSKFCQFQCPFYFWKPAQINELATLSRMACPLPLDRAFSQMPAAITVSCSGNGLENIGE